MAKSITEEILEQRLEGQPAVKFLLAGNIKIRVFWLALVAGLLTFSALSILYSGSGARVAVHLIYIPIFVLGLALGPAGGVLAGIVAGLLVSPLTPVGMKIPEPLWAWMFRLGFFTMTGLVVGLVADLLKAAVINYLMKGALDESTGLPSVTTMAEMASNRLRDNLPVSVFAIHFRALRPTATAFGIDTADRIHRLAIGRLHNDLPREWRLFSGDTTIFVLVPENHPDPADLLAMVHEPVHIDMDLPLILDAVVGLAGPKDCSHDGMLMIRRAVQACDEAQWHNVPFRVFTPEDMHNLKDRLRLLADLQSGLSSPDIVLFFQPKIGLKSGHIEGAEALIRWHHPRLGWLPPGQFVPMVERSALMPALTMEVLVRAVAQAANWHRFGPAIKISVNVSAKDFSLIPVAAKVEELLKAYRLPAHLLEIEITESAATLNLDALISQADALRVLGVSLAVDDYGTGQSGLSYLLALRPQVLKIDQSFVRPMLEDKAARVMVESTLNLAQNLGIKTVAEGVENLEIARELGRLGCDQGQGYFFSSPLPAVQLAQYVKAYATFPQ